MRVRLDNANNQSAVFRARFYSTDIAMKSLMSVKNDRESREKEWDMLKESYSVLEVSPFESIEPVAEFK